MRSPQADWACPGQAWVHCSLCPSWSARRKTCLRWTGACSCRWRRTWRRLGECLSAGSRSLSCVVCGRPIVHASLLPEFPRSCDVPPLACSIQRVCGRDAPCASQSRLRMRLQRCETPLLPDPWVARLRRVCRAAILNALITGVCTPKHHTPLGAVFIPVRAVLSCSSSNNSRRMSYVRRRAQRSSDFRCFTVAEAEAAQARRWRLEWRSETCQPC